MLPNLLYIWTSIHSHHYPYVEIKSILSNCVAVISLVHAQLYSTDIGDSKSTRQKHFNLQGRNLYVLFHVFGLIRMSENASSTGDASNTSAAVCLPLQLYFDC
uniref:Uncharacterized protein n=1 Tax=Trichobilharzia regenti TaxID=157069 RepID=A0AA85JC21_TRIRE|nr:unnamed protein product [Trichobilharzia regenti]